MLSFPPSDPRSIVPTHRIGKSTTVLRCQDLTSLVDRSLSLLFSEWVEDTTPKDLGKPISNGIWNTGTLDHLEQLPHLP